MLVLTSSSWFRIFRAFCPRSTHALHLRIRSSENTFVFCSVVKNRFIVRGDEFLEVAHLEASASQVIEAVDGVAFGGLPFEGV